MEEYYEIVSPGEGEYTEKKSRFIAHAFPVKSEEETSVVIEQLKRKYWDARHNCYAYVINNGMQSKCSDDGEPSGTAGRPILDVINGKGIRNILVVVTRYFGGTLLGTGGLIRAYTQAAKEAIEASGIKRMMPGTKIEITAEYNDAGRLKHYFETEGISIENIEYTDAVKLLIAVKAEKKEAVMDKVTQVTSGKGALRIVEEGFMPL